MQITDTKHHPDGSMTMTIVPEVPNFTDLIILRTSLVRVAQAAGVDLSLVGLDIAPTFPQIDHAARHRVNGWNTLCNYIIDHIETMQKRFAESVVASVPAPPVGAVRAEWDTRVMMPEHWDKYITSIREYHGMSQFIWDCATNEAKKDYADKYDAHATYRRLQEGRF